MEIGEKGHRLATKWFLPNRGELAHKPFWGPRRKCLQSCLLCDTQQGSKPLCVLVSPIHHCSQAPSFQVAPYAKFLTTPAPLSP